MIAEQLHTYLREGTGEERERVGPFLATFTPSTDHPKRNYAIPDDGATPSVEEIVALVTLFRGRDLQPRLEYAERAAPELEGILRDAGFGIEARLPVLTCAPDWLRDLEPPAGVQIADALTDVDHSDAIVVAANAYGSAHPAPDASAVAGRRALVARGGGVVIAREIGSGRAVGSGLHPPPRASVTEVAAVATVEGFRRRGVASSLTQRLSAHAFDVGARVVWLTAEHPEEAHAAERAGFRDSGEAMIHISLQGKVD